MNREVVFIGCVHGRFQPPHLEHLEYIEEALSRTSKLIIGITQPNSTDLDECNADPHRALPSENPLTYGERCECIRAMLVERGISADRYEFTPFIIDRPAELKSSLDPSVVCFTTIRDQWNINKIEILRTLGFQVEVLWDRSHIKGISGTDIRRRIRSNDDSWKSVVHPDVAAKLEMLGIVARIRAAS